MISSIFDPIKWDLRHYLAVTVALCAINLFGPRGFVHLYYLKKESERIKSEKIQTAEQIVELEEEIAHFQKSDEVKSRAIRRQLGYVRDNEIVVELPKRLNTFETKEVEVLR